MTVYECPCEQDVLDAVASRRWPARCDEELRRHVASCAACADLVEVAAALLEESHAECQAPALPPASLVWWRAQLRAREDAARAAARPLRLLPQVALVCAGAAIVVGLIAAAPLVWTWLLDASFRVPTIALPTVDPRAAREAALAALANRGVQLAAAAWLILGPVALYLALTDDR